MAFYPKATALNGWHPGEVLMQRKLGYEQAPGLDQMWHYIYAEMTDQQRIFHTSNLHFLPVVTLDKKGRPWSSVLAAGDGQIGWIQSIKPKSKSRLEMKPKVWVGDPFWENVEPFGEEGSDGVLFAGIGVEVSTRRRNKLAGKILSLERKEEDREVTLTAHAYENTGSVSRSQSILHHTNCCPCSRNCPKYIVVRSVEPHPDTHPVIVHDKLEMEASDRLPAEVISFIHTQDTLWFGSACISSSPKFPSHLGINHRGGRPGYARVKPSDGRTLVLPDLSGNRFMSSLGNIEVTPVASVTIVDWETGDILYLTGDAVNLVGADAEKVMPMQKALTELRVTGYRFVKDAVPVRQKVGVQAEVSPYSPPVKLLREELEAQGVEILAGGNGDIPQAKLEKVELHSPTIATFTFSSSVPLRIRPGQAIILDFKRFLGTPEYQHMAESRPSSVNDDFIRTWTVSSTHLPVQEGKDGESGKTTFELTMKEKEGGVVTGALFRLVWRCQEMGREVATVNLQAGIVGVSGEFYLDLEQPLYVSGSDLELGPPRKLVWAAGGIGITPFLTMLRALVTSPAPSVHSKPWDITFLLSTREPEVLLPLLAKVYTANAASNVRLQLHVFTQKRVPDVDWHAPCELVVHKGRLGAEWFREEKDALKGREAYICGSQGFENVVLDALVQEVGLEKDKVRKEGFAY